MKKIISVLLIITTLFAFSLTCFALMTPEGEEDYYNYYKDLLFEKYTDLDHNYDSNRLWSVIRAYNNSIMLGVSDSRWMPDKLLTRGELIVIYYNIFYRGDLINIDLPFSDVRGTEYYCSALKVMYSKGIIVGNENGEFEAERLVRSEEAAAIFGRILLQTGYVSPEDKTAGFDNVLYAGEVSSWAYKDCSRLYPNLCYAMLDFNRYHPKCYLRRLDMADIYSGYFTSYYDGE